MKYCVSSRQSAAILQTVEQIKVEWRDRASITDLFEKYPDSDIILEVREKLSDDDQVFLRNLNILGKGKFQVCLGILEEISTLKNLDISFYWGYPISTVYECLAWVKEGVSSIVVGCGLFFNIETIATQNPDIKFRLAPTSLNEFGPLTIDPNIAAWVRPEDIHLYENLVEVCEFPNCSLNKEAALVKIYRSGVWIGKLSELIDPRLDILSHKLSPEFGKRRLDCGQKCLLGSSCQRCYHEIILARTESDLLKK